MLSSSRREQFVAWLFGVLPGTDLEASIDNTLAKVFAPVEKILGVTLLGASTVNTITGRNGN